MEINVNNSDIHGLDALYGSTNVNIPYTKVTPSDIEIPRGAEDFGGLVQEGEINKSVINKLHLLKIKGSTALEDTTLQDKYRVLSAAELCSIINGMHQYDVDDFMYCKWLGVPTNRLITLRRFPVPVTDNITTLTTKGSDGKSYVNNDVGDIARMVTYMTADTNKIDDVLSLSYGLRWKQLTAEYDQMSMFGEQSGVSGFTKKIAAIFDNTTNSNYLSGRSTGGPMSQFDPKFDQNRVYGPVDSINETHIRDVGFDFTKDFEITFDYELRSINGRTPEYAFKDLLANILACTFNDGTFWAGARYWVGERPSPWAKKLQWMNADNIDTVMAGMYDMLKTGLKSFFNDPKGSSLNTLKKFIKGGFALAMGKLLDGLGRPGIPAMQSLLSSEPVGCWHLTIGNPLNPIMCIGNLLLTGTDIKFPTDNLSYGSFPTKIQVIVKLKPGMPKDRSGIETIFNHGQQRLYWQPKKVQIIKGSTGKFNKINRTERLVNSEQPISDIIKQFNEAYSFRPFKDQKSQINIIVEENGVTQVAEQELYPNYSARNDDGSEYNAAAEAQKQTALDKQAEAASKPSQPSQPS